MRPSSSSSSSGRINALWRPERKGGAPGGGGGANVRLPSSASNTESLRGVVVESSMQGVRAELLPRAVSRERQAPHQAARAEAQLDEAILRVTERQAAAAGGSGGQQQAAPPAVWWYEKHGPQPQPSPELAPTDLGSLNLGQLQQPTASHNVVSRDVPSAVVTFPSASAAAAAAAAEQPSSALSDYEQEHGGRQRESEASLQRLMYPGAAADGLAHLNMGRPSVRPGPPRAAGGVSHSATSPPQLEALFRDTSLRDCAFPGGCRPAGQCQRP